VKRIVVATRNQGKLIEIRTLLGSSFDVVGFASLDNSLYIEEDAETFEGNASKKAVQTASHFQVPCLADDSGLEVDFLGGAPGVYSARFGGPDLSDADRCDLLLSRLAGVDIADRSARFRAVLAYAVPGGDTSLLFGTLEGYVALEKQGNEGFGYDPIFIPAGYQQSLAVLGASTKNKISHRARALAAFVDFIRDQTRSG